MPLSEHEQRLLEQLEAQLHSEDPRLANTLGSGSSRTVSARHIVLGALLAIAGIVVVVVGVHFQLIIVGVLGFLIVAGGIYWATSRGTSTTPQDGQSQGGSGSGGGGPAPRKGAFMTNLEERWEQRNRGEQ